ncbi:glycosyl hydrolase [Halioxenophilus aromaticivorans]|uniref:glycosyl hydrolase n=1 Tax=Halioxenophilus aromaticivorans TaxID=1306992 RepID=UPI0031EFE21F
MNRIGIGGLQNFDAALLTLQIVEQRLVNMSTLSRSAFKFSVPQASYFNLGLDIAASLGWSETDGLCIPIQDAIKKLMGSEVSITACESKAVLLPTSEENHRRVQIPIGRKTALSR